MLEDAYGLPVSTDSPEAITAIDTFVDNFLGYGQQADAILKAVEHDPECALAQACCAALYMFLESRQAPDLARPFLQAARQNQANVTSRERLFCEAVGAWVENDIEHALRCHEQLAEQYPQDLAALKLGQYHYFNLGDAVGMLRLARKAKAVGINSPYLDAMLAFGYEQCYQLNLAEQVARSALQAKADEPWAHHAMAHIYGSTGKITEGIAFLEPHSASWTNLNSFMRTHNWWHLCLLYIEQQQFDRVLEIYPEHIWGVWKEYSQDQIGAVSLLARLELAGVPVPNQYWQDLADYLAVRIEDHIQSFLSLHYLYGLARAERPEAEAMLVSLSDQARYAKAPARAVWAEVALPLAYALLAYASGQYVATVQRLEPLLNRLQRIGGSHAQRGLFWQIYLDALLRSGRQHQATLFIQKRFVTPIDHLTAHKLADLSGKITLV